MCAIDIMSIATENVIDLVGTVRVEHAEQANAQLAKLAPREAELGLAWLETSCQNQRNAGRQPRLDGL